jgi:hypothetical protein
MHVCDDVWLYSSYCKKSMCVYVSMYVYVYVCMYEEISYKRNKDVKYLYFRTRIYSKLIMVLLPVVIRP